MKFRIAMDSAGEFSEDMKEMDECRIVPLTLIFGDEEFIDDGTLDPEFLVRKIAECPICAKTACPSPEAYYRQYDCDAKHIYGVTISGELSGSYQSAVIAREMYLEKHPDAKIHVFNSRSTSVGETIITHMITEMEEAGVAFEEICEKIENWILEKRTYFTLDNLETLRKNGRLSRLKALAASVLKIKPICIGNEEGIIEQIDQARGSNKALIKMVDHVIAGTANPEEKILGISFVNCRSRAVMVRDAILKRMKVRKVIMQEMGGLSTVYSNDGGIIVVI